MFKFALFATFVAATQAVLAPAYPGYPSGYPAVPAVGAVHQNIVRSYGNLGQVSTYSKALDTPYSSVRKSDVRVSNPGIYGAYAHAPAYAPYAHGPAYAPLAHAPIAHAGPAAGLLGVAYSPAVAVSHMSYSAPAISYAW